MQAQINQALVRNVFAERVSLDSSSSSSFSSRISSLSFYPFFFSRYTCALTFSQRSGLFSRARAFSFFFFFFFRKLRLAFDIDHRLDWRSLAF